VRKPQLKHPRQGLPGPVASTSTTLAAAFVDAFVGNV
jgi:hypothetical protein